MDLESGSKSRLYFIHFSTKTKFSNYFRFFFAIIHQLKLDELRILCTVLRNFKSNILLELSWNKYSIQFQQAKRSSMKMYSFASSHFQWILCWDTNIWNWIRTSLGIRNTLDFLVHSLCRAIFTVWAESFLITPGSVWTA